MSVGCKTFFATLGRGGLGGGCYDAVVWHALGSFSAQEALYSLPHVGSLIHSTSECFYSIFLDRHENQLSTITNNYNYKCLHSYLSYLSFEKQRLAFVPPKPKLFEMATLTVFHWATLGT